MQCILTRSDFGKAYLFLQIENVVRVYENIIIKSDSGVCIKSSRYYCISCSSHALIITCKYIEKIVVSSIPMLLILELSEKWKPTTN